MIQKTQKNGKYAWRAKNRYTEDTMPETSFAVERYGQLKDMDRSFDITYWQRQGPDAIFAAAWELVVEAQARRGGDDELRLQRAIESFQRQQR